MEHITSAPNTAVPAYLALETKGFRVRRQLVNSTEEWIAERDGLRISGASPLEILGLYTMRQLRGLAWKAQDSEIEEFLRQFYPDDKDV